MLAVLIEQITDGALYQNRFIVELPESVRFLSILNLHKFLTKFYRARYIGPAGKVWFQIEGNEMYEDCGDRTRRLELIGWKFIEPRDEDIVRFCLS